MLNMDMVGRMRGNRLSVLGGESAAEWEELVRAACAKARGRVRGSGDGYGPSDQTPFYAAGVPVLHFFTGAHADYHKPRDTRTRSTPPAPRRSPRWSPTSRGARWRADGAHLQGGHRARAARGHAQLQRLARHHPRLRRPPDGQKGVLLSGVRPGSAAEQGRAAPRRRARAPRHHEIGERRGLDVRPQRAKPGETVTAVVLRDGKEVSLEVTFQESKRGH